MKSYPKDLPLDIAGAIEGLDKSSSQSLRWGYLDAYERTFQQFRNRSFNIIEIGVLSGNSLRLWERFFPKARVIGVDINESCRRFANNQTTIEIGSQADRDFTNSLGVSYTPLIVIDDGSHQAGDIISTFESLFVHVQPGGIYVVEDTAFHFHGARSAKWNRSNAMPIDNYFLMLAKSMMARRLLAEGSSTR